MLEQNRDADVEGLVADKEGTGLLWTGGQTVRFHVSTPPQHLNLLPVHVGSIAAPSAAVVKMSGISELFPQRRRGTKHG